MWKGRFSEKTSDIVLKFTQSLDLDWCMAVYDIAGSIAHAEMLASIGILTEEEKQLVVNGLLEVRNEIMNGTMIPSVEFEDVHMNIENRLTELVGPAGAKLHSGRSRNDQIATTFRLFLRDKLVNVGYMLEELMKTFMERAETHNGLIIPGFTHLQQAQPINMGHYWMSHFNSLLRDSKALIHTLETNDESPLGSGALAGSTLPLDREMTAELLNFSEVSSNSLDSVSNRDHILDYHYFASRFMLHCSKLCEDLVIYSSQEFGWVILPDAFCTGSSMMPQKKNPDILELVRGKSGQVTGSLFDLMMLIKGLPSTYNRDMQEDKRGFLSSVMTVEAVMEVMNALISEVEVNSDMVFQGSKSGFCLATDVAEYLVMKGIPFRDAHWKVGRLVKWCLDNNVDLAELSMKDWKEQIPEAEEDLLKLMTLEASVKRRNTTGGTSPESVRRQLQEGKKKLAIFMEKLQSYETDLFHGE